MNQSHYDTARSQLRALDVLLVLEEYCPAAIRMGLLRPQAPGSLPSANLDRDPEDESDAHGDRSEPAAPSNGTDPTARREIFVRLNKWDLALYAEARELSALDCRIWRLLERSVQLPTRTPPSLA